MDPFGIILKSFPFRLRDTHTYMCTTFCIYSIHAKLVDIHWRIYTSKLIHRQTGYGRNILIPLAHTHTPAHAHTHTHIHWIFVHLKMAQNICNGNKFNLSAFMWKIHFILLQYNWAWVPMLMLMATATATMMMTMVFLVSLVMLVVKPVWETVEAIRKYDNNSIVIVLTL